MALSHLIDWNQYQGSEGLDRLTSDFFHGHEFIAYWARLFLTSTRLLYPLPNFGPDQINFPPNSTEKLDACYRSLLKQMPDFVNRFWSWRFQVGGEEVYPDVILEALSQVAIAMIEDPAADPLKIIEGFLRYTKNEIKRGGRDLSFDFLKPLP